MFKLTYWIERFSRFYNEYIQQKTLWLGRVGLLASFLVLIVWGGNLYSLVFFAYCLILFQNTLYFRFLTTYRWGRPIRSLTRLLFYTWPLLFLVPPIPSITYTITYKPYIFAVGAIVLFILLRKEELQIALSPDFLTLLEPIPLDVKLRLIIAYFLGAVVQEIFYRGILITALKPIIGWPVIVISAIFFVVEHIFHGPGAFDRYDYVLQTLLSILCGAIFFVFGDIIACMLVHIFYNVPRLYLVLRSPTTEAST